MALSDNQRARKRPRAKASLLDIGLRLAEALGLPQDKRGPILDLTEELESRLLEAAEAAESVADSGALETQSTSKQFTAPGSNIPAGVPTRATGSTTLGWNFKPPVPSDADGSYQEFEAVVVSGEAVDVGCALSISGDRVKLARVATVTDPDLWCNAVCTRIVSPTKVRYRCGGTMLLKKRVTTAASGTVFLSSAGFFTDDPGEIVAGREFVQYLGTWKEYGRKPDAIGGGDSGIGYACFSFTPPISKISQVVTVAKDGGMFDSWQAAVDYVDGLGDCSSTKPYAILGYPGMYLESVVVDVAYLTLVGLGGPEATIIRNDADTTSAWDCPLRIAASNVTVIGLGLRNLKVVADPNAENTVVLGVGNLTSPGPVINNAVVRGCIVQGTSRDALYARMSGSLLVEDCQITGYSHTPAFETGDLSVAGGAVALSVIVRRCVVTNTVASWWVGAATTDTLALSISDCQTTVAAGEPMFYLQDRGTGASTITVNNSRCSSGMYLYQTPASHTGDTTINHAGVVVDADRTGALVGTVTLTAREQRALKAATLEATEGDITGALGIRGSRLYLTDEGTAATAGIAADDSISGVSVWTLAGNGSLDAYAPFKATVLHSTQTTGTAPLTVASTTKVTNLNVDLLDDLSSAAFVQHTIADAKGDLLAATAADAFARVAVGTEGQVLSSNAAAAGGVAYIWVPRFVGAITADSTELTLDTVPKYFDQTITLPANSLRAGAVLRFVFGGKTTTVGAGSRQFALMGDATGTTVLIADPAPGVAGSLTNKAWVCFGDLTCRTSGAAGTFAAIFQESNYGQVAQYPVISSGSIDTTIAHLLRVRVNLSAGDANHKATLTHFRVDVS